MSYAIKQNNGIVLDCGICGELTHHYPVKTMGALSLECEVCMLSWVD